MCTAAPQNLAKDLFHVARPLLQLAGQHCNDLSSGQIQTAGLRPDAEGGMRMSKARIESAPENPLRSKLDRRSILIGTGLALAGALSHLAAPKVSAKPITQANFRGAIPSKVGGWTSRKSQEVVLPPQDESNELYENQETRIYEGPGLPSIMLLIAFSSVQQNDVQVHRPEVCYPSSGFPIISTGQTEISYDDRKLSGRELVADRGGLRERIIYWIRVGNFFPTTWREQRIDMALENLTGSVPDGVLFRVSTLENRGDNTSEALRDFIKAFLDEVTPSFRQKVLL
jgi:EpsI family protein